MEEALEVLYSAMNDELSRKHTSPFLLSMLICLASGQGHLLFSGRRKSIIRLLSIFDL